MLGIPSKKDQKILDERGISAPGTLLEMKRGHFGMTRGSDPRPEATSFNCTMTIEVHPPDGEPFVVEVKQRFPQTSLPEQGQQVTVLFDPEDHDRLIVTRLAPPGPAAGFAEGFSDDIMRLMQMAMGGASPDAVMQQAQSIDGVVVQGSSINIDAMGNVTTAGTDASGPEGTSAADAEPASGGAAPPDLAAQLERLAALHAAGQLTDEEYSQAKQRLLVDS